MLANVLDGFGLALSGKENVGKIRRIFLSPFFINCIFATEAIQPNELYNQITATVFQELQNVGARARKVLGRNSPKV